MATPHRVNPRVRAYGKARIDITRRAQDERDWQQKWREPRNPFPFEFSAGWRQCIEYRVDDYAAEVGFFIDVLSFPVVVFSESYAQFTSPERDFFFIIAATREGEESIAPSGLRLQFHIENLEATVEELERRGVEFVLKPEIAESGDQVVVSYFRSPHGIYIDLIGTTAPKEQEDQPVTDQKRQSTSPAASLSIAGLLDLENGDSYADIWDVVGDRNSEEDDLEVEISPAEEEDTVSPAGTELGGGEGEEDYQTEAERLDREPATRKRPPNAHSRARKHESATPIEPQIRDVRRRELPLRNGVFDWSLKKDRKNGEPTYSKLEDDFPVDDE